MLLMRYRCRSLVICLPAASVAERLRQAGCENLTIPTRSQLGKKVVFVTSPFQTGLPVPSDQDAEEVKQRYIVVDVTWQLLKK